MLRILAACTATLLLLLIGSPDAARSDDSFLILQSSPLVPYEAARNQLIRSIQDTPLDSGPKSIAPHQIESVFLDKEPDPNALRAKISASPPALIMAIGRPALVFAADLKDIPIVALLAPGLETVFQQHARMTGVLLEIPPAVQLALMQRLFPDKPPILLHDAAQNGAFARAATAAAEKTGVSLVTLSAAAPRDIPRLLSVLTENAGLFWMIPDTTVVTPDNIEQIIGVSLAKKVPVVTFAEKYLSQGAAVAITAPPAAMAEQAVSLTHRLLRAGPGKKIAPLAPDHIHITINRNIMEKLGVRVPPPTALPPRLSLDDNEVHLEMVFQP